MLTPYKFLALTNQAVPPVTVFEADSVERVWLAAVQPEIEVPVFGIAGWAGDAAETVGVLAGTVADQTEVCFFAAGF